MDRIMVSSSGNGFKVVGLGAVNLIKFMATAVKFRNEAINVAVIRSGFVNLSHDLFMNSPTSNILHNAHVSLLSAFIEPPSGKAFVEVVFDKEAFQNQHFQ